MRSCYTAYAQANVDNECFMNMKFCPCGSSQKYLNCCGRFIDQQQTPETPEQLMRSRYTAYTQANIDYIEKTMQGKAAIGFSKEEARQWAKQAKWLGLRVLNVNANDAQGFVEFIAYYGLEKQRHAIHEKSEFHRVDGKWFYVGCHPGEGRDPRR